jgi:tripartite-type tricarboxylate transporter receptor subunit TctC
MNDIEFLILVNEEHSSFTSIEDLVNYGKENTIKYGIGGAGGDQHIVMAAFLEMAETKAKPVVYQGTLDSINSLLGGHVDVAVGIPSVVKDQVESGQLKVIGSFSPEPYLAFEGIDPIPTVRSAGYDMEYIGFNFLAAPAGTPKEVVDFLNEKLKEMYQDPEIIQIATNLDLSLNPMKAEDVGTFVENQKESTRQFIELMNNAAEE